MRWFWYPYQATIFAAVLWSDYAYDWGPDRKSVVFIMAALAAALATLVIVWTRDLASVWRNGRTLARALIIGWGLTVASLALWSFAVKAREPWSWGKEAAFIAVLWILFLLVINVVVTVAGFFKRRSPTDEALLLRRRNNRVDESRLPRM